MSEIAGQTSEIRIPYGDRRNQWVDVEDAERILRRFYSTNPRTFANYWRDFMIEDAPAPPEDKPRRGRPPAVTAGGG